MEREGAWKWVNIHGATAPATCSILTTLLAVLLQQSDLLQL